MNSIRSLQSLRVGGIIHLFALLHATVALLCQLSQIDDELVLTLLTIVMIVLICLKRGLSVEFTAASVIVGNVLGYLLGTGCARLIELFVPTAPVVHAAASFITTELLGWSIVWFTMLFRRSEDAARRALVWTPRIGWLLVAVGVIFGLRLVYVQLFAMFPFTTDRVYLLVDTLSSNSVSLIILLCLNVIYVRHTRRRPLRRNAFSGVGGLLLFLLLTSAGFALVVGLGLPFQFDRSLTVQEFVQLWSISLLIEATLYSVVFMIDYAWASRAVLRAERGKTHQAQFRYMTLKQQLNPHFLFNSLNILDCLVCEQQNREASDYIHKLAGVYRYMLQNEQETLVRLRDEMAFVGMYVDLLKVRFPEGFSVDVQIPDAALNRFVVPCAVQLLIENAIKHNSVAVDHPLKISIVAANESITVKNNLQPKVSAAPSMRVGHQYIRQQYLDLADVPIGIHRSRSEYCVTLPLL